MKLLRACTPEECELIDKLADDPTTQLEPAPYTWLIHSFKSCRGENHDKELGAKVDSLTEVVQAAVLGGHHFTGFLNAGKRIRLHYNWGAEDGGMYFQGVGYLTTEELKQGFFVVADKRLDVYGCSACGEDHKDLHFPRVENGVAYGECPTNGIPLTAEPKV